MYPEFMIQRMKQCKKDENKNSKIQSPRTSDKSNFNFVSQIF